jgi:(1->4)-alpha-D-glucan 1-alpha-D-glucosylmutase
LADGPATALADAFPSWLTTPGDGRAKLWITCRLLGYRAAHAEILAAGDYLPVTAMGARGGHVVAFARRHGDTCAIAVAGRMFASLGLSSGAMPVGKQAWGDSALDVAFLPRDVTVVNVLTREALSVRDGRIAMADAFRLFPGAFLHCITARPR